MDIEIHVGTPDAVHMQPDVVATEKLLVVPLEDADTLVGVTVNVHVPLCVAVNVRPPMVTLSARCPPLLGANLIVTVPFPAPLAPAVTVIHEAEVEAVHAQPLGAVTATLLVSPAAGIVRLVGAMAYVHPVALAAACVIVTVCPAIVSVPLRLAVAVLAVAANTTEPVPVAGIADVIVSQLAFATAVQAHDEPAVTEIEAVVAAATSAADVAVTAGVHGAELAKKFDNSLPDAPPGPTAQTLA